MGLFDTFVLSDEDREELGLNCKDVQVRGFSDDMETYKPGDHVNEIERRLPTAINKHTGKRYVVIQTPHYEVDNDPHVYLVMIDGIYTKALSKHDLLNFMAREFDVRIEWD